MHASYLRRRRSITDRRPVAARIRAAAEDALARIDRDAVRMPGQLLPVTPAIDAAIATSAVLAVVYPHMTGIGGDAFWLIHDGASGEVKYLNGGGKAAASASLVAMEQRGLKEIPLRGIVPATLTVPGSVASWIAAHVSSHPKDQRLHVYESYPDRNAGMYAGVA